MLEAVLIVGYRVRACEAELLLRYNKLSILCVEMHDTFASS